MRDLSSLVKRTALAQAGMDIVHNTGESEPYSEKGGPANKKVRVSKAFFKCSAKALHLGVLASNDWRRYHRTTRRGSFNHLDTNFNFVIKALVALGERQIRQL